MIFFYTTAQKTAGKKLIKLVSTASAIPIVVVSTWNDAESAVEMIKSGATEFILESNLKRLSTLLKKNLLSANPSPPKTPGAIFKRDIPLRYKEFFEKSNDAIFIHDFEGKIIDMNPKALELFGYSRAEMKKLTVFDFHSEEELSKSREAFEKISREGYVNFETEFLRKDGSSFSGEVSSSIFEVRGQKLINGIVRDISDRKKAEAAIRESEKLFREALNTIPDSIAIHRLKDGAFVYINSGYTHVSGYRPEEVLGKTTQEIHIWADPADVNRFRKMLLKDGFVRNFKARFRLKSGEIHTGLVSASIIMFRGERHFLAITKDIEDLIQAQIEIQQSEKIYRSLIEQSNDGIYILYNNRFEIVNRRFIEMYGYTLEELNDPSFEPMQLIAPRSRPYMEGRLHKLKAGEYVEPIYEFTALTKDGREIDCEVSISYLPYKDGTAAQGVLRDISERKKKEAQLKQLSLAVEQSASSIMITELDGTVTYVNPQFCQASGFSRQEVIGKKARDFGWNNGSGYRKMMERIRRGKDWHGETLNSRKDGQKYWEYVSITPIFDEEGHPSRIVKVGEDITERKKIEREKELYSLLLQNSQDLIAIASLEGNLLFVNPAGRELLGLEPDEDVTHLKISDFQTAGSYQKALVEEIRAVQTVGYYSGESVVKQRKTGRIIPVRITAFLVKDPETGRPLAMATIQTDISRQKKAETELLRLASAVEQSHDPIIITSLQGKIEYVNAAFEKITGYHRDEVLGKNPRILKSGKQDPKLYENLWSTIGSGTVWKGELINRRKDGSLYVAEAIILPIKDSAGELINYIAVEKDITNVKRLEEEFRQAQKMEAVGRLAGGVAHDFNNLLTVINGYTNLLLQKISPGDSSYKKILQIQKAGEQAARLTSQLLAFSRKQVVQPRILNINDVLEELSKMLKRLLGEDILLSIRTDPNPANIKIDPGQLEQIIMNLSINARDSMPDGGHLHIETANMKLDHAFVESHLGSHAGNYVYLAVSDTGAGMTKDVLSHIFEPFFTTKTAGKGTGLGLSTVYGIIKQCQGFVEVNSEPGNGTTFKIYFPAAEGKKHKAKVTGDNRRELHKGSETILIVEDEDSVRGLAVTILREQGYHILEAPAADEALRLLQREQCHIDLLLTDMVMPRTNGRDLAQKICDYCPQIKVVYMSGYTDNALLAQKDDEPEITFIHKPFSPIQLVKTIRSVLDARN